MGGHFRSEEVVGSEDRAGANRGFDDFDLRLGDVMRGERATMGKSLLDVQRDLRIKAGYIAAIENTDPAAFETPGFIAGYVRSYSRYLGLDPEWAWERFRRESGFGKVHPAPGVPGATATGRGLRESGPRDPFADGSFGALAPRRGGVLSNVEFGAIGSVLVLAGLIGLIGYGGYAVLNEVQKVQFVPVEQAPGLIADLDPLEAVRQPVPDAPDGSGVEAAATDAFDRLYRPQALDVPVLVARDAPISTLDPRMMGALAMPVADPRLSAPQAGTSGLYAPALDGFAPEGDAGAVASVAGGDTPGGVQVVAETVPQVVMFAVRPSWVRVRAGDGTVLYEKLMREGDSFSVPLTEEPATLRTGESGAIYFTVDGRTYGPAGRSGAVTSGLALGAASLTESFAVADPQDDRDLARVVAELQRLPAETPGTAPMAAD